MALIKCPECGKEISDTCDVCIHCGYKLQTKKKSSLKWKWDKKISIVIIRLSQPGGKESEYCLSRSIFCARTAALHSRHDAICLSGMRLPASMSPYLITDQLPFSSSASADIVSTQSPELR